MLIEVDKPTVHQNDTIGHHPNQASISLKLDLTPRQEMEGISLQEEADLGLPVKLQDFSGVEANRNGTNP